jgi:hypothetical protein
VTGTERTGDSPKAYSHIPRPTRQPRPCAAGSPADSSLTSGGKAPGPQIPLHEMRQRQANDSSAILLLRSGRVPEDQAAQNARPAYSAELSSISSIRMSWLYLARRSERLSDPVLDLPQFVASGSAIVCLRFAERCDMTL